MDLPDLSESAETAREGVKNLVPWLPDPEQCPECGQYMDATRAYDSQQAAFHPGGMAPAWECADCGVTLRRVEDWHE